MSILDNIGFAIRNEDPDGLRISLVDDTYHASGVHIAVVNDSLEHDGIQGGVVNKAGSVGESSRLGGGQVGVSSNAYRLKGFQGGGLGVAAYLRGVQSNVVNVIGVPDLALQFGWVDYVHGGDDLSGIEGSREDEGPYMQVGLLCIRRNAPWWCRVLPGIRIHI
jgi:hypothetical protein